MSEVTLYAGRERKIFESALFRDDGVQPELVGFVRYDPPIVVRDGEEVNLPKFEVELNAKTGEIVNIRWLDKEQLP